jgi:hypothetical protein
MSKVIDSYRARCKEYYQDYLKTIDLELRTILKPLIPNQVIDENVKFPHLNNNPSLQSSERSYYDDQRIETNKNL